MATAWLTEAEAAERWPASRIALVTGGVTAVVTRAILRAESRVMSELVALRYAPADLPSTPTDTGEALKRIVGGFFWHYLHEGVEIRGEDVRDAYKDAQAELKAVGIGNLSLLLAGEPAVDNVRPRILTARQIGSSAVTDSGAPAGYCRPSLDGCWDGFD